MVQSARKKKNIFGLRNIEFFNLVVVQQEEDAGKYGVGNKKKIRKSGKLLQSWLTTKMLETRL